MCERCRRRGRQNARLLKVSQDWGTDLESSFVLPGICKNGTKVRSKHSARKWSYRTRPWPPRRITAWPSPGPADFPGNLRVRGRASGNTPPDPPHSLNGPGRQAGNSTSPGTITPFSSGSNFYSSTCLAAHGMPKGITSNVALFSSFSWSIRQLQSEGEYHRIYQVININSSPPLI